MPLPQNDLTGEVPELEGSNDIDPVPETVKVIDPVEVKDPVTELVREMVKVPDVDMVLDPVGV